MQPKTNGNCTSDTLYNNPLILRFGTLNRSSSTCVNICEGFVNRLSWVYLTADQFVLVSGSPLGSMTRFYPCPFSSDNCFVVLPVGRPLWREDGSVTYSAIADWSDHCGTIAIHYRLIWDCVPSSSPLTTRRDCGGGILTRLHTGPPTHCRTRFVKTAYFTTCHGIFYIYCPLSSSRYHYALANV
jgi:hypothetical protein